jgi:hypothetical protein
LFFIIPGISCSLIHFFVYMQIGGMTGVSLAVTLFIGFGSFTILLTDDPAVLEVAKSGVWVMIFVEK